MHKDNPFNLISKKTHNFFSLILTYINKNAFFHHIFTTLLDHNFLLKNNRINLQKIGTFSNHILTIFNDNIKVKIGSNFVGFHTHIPKLFNNFVYLCEKNNKYFAVEKFLLYLHSFLHHASAILSLT